MPTNASGDVRSAHVEDPYPDVATFMMARALAEAFGGTAGDPVPEPLAAILRQIES